ncbi:MAG: ATP-binding cassette domain-containing protein [Bacteriovoracia bacterium]
MIQVQDLTKMYGVRAAVQNLNFEIQKGEVVGFLGPNGAGKSTTMKIITCFMPPTSGTAKVAGYDIAEDPIEVKRNIGYLPETPPVYREMVVEDYLEFAAKLHDVPSPKVSSAVRTAIDKIGLGDVRRRLIGNLSKGYQQRVGLAQALVHDPKVLILDEPTVGLDPNQIIEIRKLIKSLGGDHTVILSSHILPEVTATCQRIIVISKGQIVAQDTLEKLTTRLKKGLIYRMTVRNPSAGGMSSLEKVAGVTRVAVEGNGYTIELDPKASEVRDQVVAAAVGSGMGVLEFAAEKLSLEEIFLQLTTQE